MSATNRMALVAGMAAAVLLGAGYADALTIQGHVLKGEAREPTPGISVSLHIVQGNEELPGKTATSDADGAFQFAGLGSDPQLSYFISTEYEGAFYTEGPVEPAGSGVALQDLMIYDVGRDISAVSVTNHHIIVERKPEFLNITEILVFENAGKTAYLGTGLNHAENAGIRLGLPASVKGFQAGMGGDDQTVRVQGRDLASLRPIPVGTHPFSFTYHVPLSGRMDLSHRLYFPTAKFVVLIEDPKLRLDSASLQDAGPREQNGRKYEIYQGSNFPIGAEVTMRIQGAGVWSNPKIYPWIAAPFLIVLVLVFAAKRGRRAVDSEPARVAAAPIASAAPIPLPQSLPSADDIPGIYLFLIDALDRGLERGEFSKESHALIRSNLKRRLEAIVSDSPRAGTR